MRDEAALEATLRDMYDPASPRFRRYLTVAEWTARHAPPEEDVREVSEWLESQGLQVARRATNRLLLQFTGTVAQFVVAAGNSGGVDTPASSPYATSVGGTELVMDGPRRVREDAWYYSGSGVSHTFPMPWWQQGLTPPSYWGGPSGMHGMRATSDLALNGATSYWFTFLGVTRPNTGTSFAAPTFAGMLASLNSARAAQGKPPVGWLNSHLYTVPAVRQSFRDITTGGTSQYPAGPGWDFPTGWGAPNMEGLLRTLP
nr:S53 family serine peptidase [Archangium sp.]